MICPLDDPAALPRIYLHGAPPAPDAPLLEGDEEFEVAIAGGGLAGLSAALHLAEGGASVAVLEAREIASGGSGRAFGQVVPYAWHGRPHLLRHFGPETGGRIVEARVRQSAAVCSSPPIPTRLRPALRLARPSGRRAARLRAFQASARGGVFRCTLRPGEDRVALAGRCVIYMEGEIVV